MKYDYDYIITGGGCAGLSLAYYLTQSALCNKRVLILDTSPKINNDKTWCFWSEKELPFACSKETSWETIEILGPKDHLIKPIAPLRYTYVSSIAFYEEIHGVLAQYPNVELRYESVNRLDDLPNGCRVHTHEGEYTAHWAFNSILFPQPRFTDHYFYLQQHFGGWFLRTEKPVFTPGKMRMMDFQVEQDDDVRFVYILPFSETEALVEYTVFSENTWEHTRYEAALRDYVHNNLQIDQYEITHREQGCIPMTNHVFERQKGLHILNLGTAAGLTKPTTGYTFLNIQRDAQSIVDALSQTGKPFYKRSGRHRFAFYDRLLLYIIRNHGGLVSGIFNRLFRQNDARLILRFLDERSHLWEELPMLARLPWGPFFNAIWQHEILGKVGPDRPATLSLFKPQTHPS